MAPVLRASLRRDAHRAGVRGHPVGRSVPAGLHRVPLEWSRSHPLFVLGVGAAGAAREATRLGRGQSATPPRSTSIRSRRDDGRSPRSARPRPAGRRSARRCSSGPRACRCTPWRRSGCSSTAGSSRRRGTPTVPRARSRELEVPETLHAPDRRAARRAGPRGAHGSCRTPRCSGRRSRSAGCSRSPGSTGRARAAPGLAGAEGDLHGPGGSALAGAGAVRVPRRPDPVGRVRDPLEEGAEGATWPSPRTWRGVRGRGRRRGRRVALPPGVRCRARCG